MASMTGQPSPTQEDTPPAESTAAPKSDLTDHQPSDPHNPSLPSASRTSSFSSIRSASLIPKSKHAEPGITEVHADQASLSMPPPQTWPVKNPRAPLPQNRRESHEAWNEDAASIRSRATETGSFRSLSSMRDVAATGNGAEESDTPRLGPGAVPDKVEENALPDPAMPSSRSSFSEGDIKRMSVSSIYSMASARGIPSSAASANGSETGSNGTPRSVSGLMSSTAGKQGDTGVSNVTVTTGSQGSSGGNLAPREQHHHLSDILKRNHPQIPRSDPSATPRPQPVRDRSRAKRRLSGSTAASSHSPSSDRTLHHRERDEGLSCPSR